MQPCAWRHEVCLHLGAWEGVGENAEGMLFRQVCVKYLRMSFENA
jgi:hypothetical protein